MRGKVSKFRVVVRGADERAEHVLRSAAWNVTRDDDGAMVVDVDGRTSDEITRTLAGSDLYVADLTPVSRSLEEVFLEVTETPEVAS